MFCCKKPEECHMKLCSGSGCLWTDGRGGGSWELAGTLRLVGVLWHHQNHLTNSYTWQPAKLHASEKRETARAQRMGPQHKDQ